MLAAIEFDDELLSGCTKIHNIIADSVLVPKMNIYALDPLPDLPQLKIPIGGEVILIWTEIKVFMKNNTCSFPYSCSPNGGRLGRGSIRAATRCRRALFD